MVDIKVKAFILAIVSSVAFFAAGLLLGKTLSDLVYKDVVSLTWDIKNTLLDFETAFEILKTHPCNKKELDIITLKIRTIGKDLEHLEREWGYEDKRVLELKRYYNLLLIRLYLLTEKIKKTCNFNYTTILFFYSNEKKYLDVSIKQGKYLDYIVYKYGPKNVKVFPIEVYLTNLTSVKLLFEHYNCTKIPCLIINGKKYEGLLTVKELEKIIS